MYLGLLASLGYGYAVSGQCKEAAKILNELTQLSARKFVPAYEVAALCAGLRREDQALQWLQKAREGRSSNLRLVESDPAFDILRSDARNAGLLRRLALPQ